VNQTFLQPFLAYATKSGYTFTLNSEATGNWEAPDGEECGGSLDEAAESVDPYSDHGHNGQEG